MSKYYNLQLQNNGTSSIPMRFNTTLSIPILEKPSDWDVSVIRFRLPNYATPLFTYINNYFKMTMSYNNNSSTQDVDFIVRDINLPLAVFDIQQVIQMLNKTIGDLYTSLNAIATLPTSDMPYFTYNETTKLISYISNKNYFLSSLSTPIVITVNEAVYTWLMGFPAYFNGTNYNLQVINESGSNVSGDYITMKQQAPSLDLMSDFGGVLLTSDLPIANEYVGSNISMPIIQDYSPSDLDISTFSNFITYNAIVPYRMTRLISDCSFYSVKFDCYVVNSAGTLSIMELPPNCSANIKLQFIKHERNPYA